MKKIVMGLGAAALLASGGVAYAQAGHGEGHGAMQGGHMAKIDANNDGQITRAEMVAGAEAMFAKRDANRDGKIDKSDREATRAQRRAAMWQTLDADGNGSISKAEWDAAHAARLAKREQMRAQRQATGAAAGARGKHRSGGGHHGRMGGRTGGGGMGMMGMADANHDQTVTLAEARAAAGKHFDMLDTDKNGVVTKAEMDAMRAKHRAERKARAAN
jgi:Ca2+-binding EF-hand superfamily protein